MGDPDTTPPSLPKDAPKELRDFVECKADSVDLDLTKIGWIPAPSFVPDSAKPSATVTPGDAPGKATVNIGWGIISINLPVDVSSGQLSVDTSTVSNFSSDISDGIDKWVKQFNDVLKARKKRIGGLTITGQKINLKKAALLVAPPAAATPPPTPPPKPPLPPPTVDPPKPDPPKTSPTPPPPTDGGSGSGNKSGCFLAILAVAILGAGTGAYFLFRDDGSGHKAAPAEVTTTLPAPTTVSPTTTTLPATTTTSPPTTTIPATTTTQEATTTTSTVPSNVCEQLKGQPIGWDNAAALDGCNFNGPPIPCGGILFPCPPPGEYPPIFGFDPTVGITHQPGPPDPLTGVTGPSQADYLLWTAYGTAGTFQVQSNCGGTTLTGQAPFTPGPGPVTVIQPLLQFGPCTVTGVQFTSGPTTFLLSPLIFGTNGQYTVTSTPVPIDPTGLIAVPSTVPDAALKDLTTLIHEFANDANPECFTWLLGGVPENPCPTGTDAPYVLHPFPSGLIVGGFTANAVGATSGDPSQLSGLTTNSLFGDALFPCGQGVLATTVCPQGDTKLDAPGYVGVAVVLDKLSQASEIKADFTAAGGPTLDATNSGGTWTLAVTGPGAGDARLILRNDAAIFAVPDNLSPTLRQYKVDVTENGQDVASAVTNVDSVLKLPKVTKPGTTGDTTPVAPTETPQDFFAQLTTSLQSDPTFALLRLNPAVTDLFGEQVCVNNLNSRVDPTGSFTVDSVGAVGPFDWAKPDNTTVHFDQAQAVDITITHAGQSTKTTAHLVLVNGQYTWFTFCQ